MDTEEINDGIALLEEALNTKLLTIPNAHIKINKLLKNSLSPKMGGSSKKEKTESASTISSTKSTTSQSGSSEFSNVTGDSMSIRTLNVPSEYFSKLTDATHTESCYNLAASSKNTENNDSAQIIDLIFSANK